MRQRGQRDIARHAHAAAAQHRLHVAQRGVVFAEEPVGAGRLRRALASVDRLDIAIGRGMKIEAAAADARALRLDHGQRQHHCDCRIGGAAALAQHFRPGFGRARIGGGNDAAGLDRHGRSRTCDRPPMGGGGGAGSDQEGDKGGGKETLQHARLLFASHGLGNAGKAVPPHQAL